MTDQSIPQANLEKMTELLWEPLRFFEGIREKIGTSQDFSKLSTDDIFRIINFWTGFSNEYVKIQILSREEKNPSIIIQVKRDAGEASSILAIKCRKYNIDSTDVRKSMLICCKYAEPVFGQIKHHSIRNGIYLSSNYPSMDGFADYAVHAGIELTSDEQESLRRGARAVGLLTDSILLDQHEPSEKIPAQAGDNIDTARALPPPAVERAYWSYGWAADNSPNGLVTDQEHYNYYCDHSENDYVLPVFDTWKRYVVEGRKFYGTKKNTPRGGRSHGKAVIDRKDAGDLSEITNQLPEKNKADNY